MTAESLPQASPDEPPDPWAVPLVPAHTSRVPEVLAALRYRDFRLLLFGLFMALSSWWMAIVAQGWLVLELTNSAFWVTAVAAMMSLPFLLLAPFSGVVADRVYRKHLLMTTRSSIAVLMLIEAALIFSGRIEVWHMATIAFVAGCGFAMDIPGRQSLIPDAVPASVVPNAVAINISIFSFTTIAGPIVGAVLLTTVGAGGCFLANGIGNFALAASIAAMRIPRRVRDGRWNVIGDFVMGLRYVRTAPLTMLMLSIALVVVLTGKSWQQLAPVFVRDVYGGGEADLGILYTVAGCGAACGALTLVWLSGRTRRAPIYGAGLLVMLAGILGFAISPILSVAVLFVFIAGIGLQVTETTGQTVLLIETPEQMRGRVMALWGLMWGLQPAGVLLAGVVAELVNAQVAVGGGIALAVIALAGLYARNRATWAAF